MATIFEERVNRIQPILMTPLRRCGSHALRLRLSMNSAFYAPYPLHLVDFMPLLQYYGDLSDDNDYFRLVTDVIGFANASSVRWTELGFDPVEIFDALKDRHRSIHMITWYMLFKAGWAKNARVVMDKSLDTVEWADQLMEIFDDMLFLNVVRDPRAQVSSINRAIIHNFDTYLNAKLWVEAMNKGVALAEKYPDRVLTIRFEDLLSNQYDVIKEICQFMRIRFSEDMLDLTVSREAQSLAGRSDLWKHNYSGPIKANIDKFKKYLSMDEIELIETMTGDLMDHFSYERITEAKAVISEDQEAAAIVRSEEQKVKAWAALKEKDPQDYIMRRFRANFLADLESRLKAGDF